MEVKFNFLWLIFHFIYTIKKAWFYGDMKKVKHKINKINLKPKNTLGYNMVWHWLDIDTNDTICFLLIPQIENIIVAGHGV